MPRRSDLRSILIIGSGPIVIGQACEFDYSGTQACKVLRREGYRVVLVNSNPATIMTDPEFADATYIEPLTPDAVRAVLERERPDALLPTLGGQTALNLAMTLHEDGTLDRLGVEMIGAKPAAIRTAEDRGVFRAAMQRIGLDLPRSDFARSIEEGAAIAARLGFPVMLRPSYILGGGGTAIVADPAEFPDAAARALAASRIGEVLVEESVAGWKEFELEVMRDLADNVVVVCSIENVDPMGVHTGDSITVAPVQTLSDVEYQRMRDAALAVIREVGVETGGSNIQFAVDPATGRQVVIEMNPRVSRSSALASKATGFPIAKIAALLSVGYTLPEITNDITGVTPASFEPTIDYVVTKVPRFAFEKFEGVSRVLGTKMQSVGEAMGIGRTFPESLQKALRSLEAGRSGLGADPAEAAVRAVPTAALLDEVAVPTPDRVYQVGELARRGVAVDDIAAGSGYDPWFVDQIELVTAERTYLEGVAGDLDADGWRRAKRLGFADAQLAYLWGWDEETVRETRLAAGVRPTFKTVDTCAAEFPARTPYHYSTWEDEDEVVPAARPRVLILGSGPNRIGQGIEFDYCCVHAAFALSDAGYETVMLNCNPETVSTDYDTADRLYFEPLTEEDVRNVLDAEQPIGVIVQLGGQTPLRLAKALAACGAPIVGTSPESIDVAEDRERFSSLCRQLGIAQPPNGLAHTPAEAQEVADRVGFPLLVRPSYVLGGRAMEIVYSLEELDGAMRRVWSADGGDTLSARPVLLDRFLESAIEVDVDALADGDEVLIGGVLEHIEEAGVHSGDSACVLPPMTLSDAVVKEIAEHTAALARALSVRGLINVQYAVRGEEVFVLEANPRASRTVPFVSKATGVPLARLAARVMLGASLADLRAEGLYRESRFPGHVAVKEAVLPFRRFPGADSLLGPEMRATGEVMGIAADFGDAYARAQEAVGHRLPTSGAIFLSVADRDKSAHILEAARLFRRLGFTLHATDGTADFLASRGIPAERVAKMGEGGGRMEAPDLVGSGRVVLAVNTPRGRRARADGSEIRLAAARAGIPCVTTVSGAHAIATGMQARRLDPLVVKPLQEHLVDQLR